MRCPQCGYFNMPGIEKCGQCGQSLAAAASAPPVSFEDIYPPRARDRSAQERVEARGGRPARFLRANLTQAGIQRQNLLNSGRTRLIDSRAAMPSRQQIQADMRNWYLASAGMIPGLGHLILGLYPLALALAGAAVVLIAGVLLIRTEIADAFLWMLLALMCYSVWDVARRVFPEAPTTSPVGRMRSLRLGLMSVFIVSSTIFFGFWVTSGRYTMISMNNASEAPILQDGDTMLGENITNPTHHGISRGEIVLANTTFGGDGMTYDGEQVPGQAFPIIERVLGLPGDIVASAGGKLFVNQKPLSRSELPLTYRPLKDFVVTVPAGDVCLWQPPVFAQRDGQAMQWRQDPYVLVQETDISTRVMAIVDPPSRRRWFH